MEDNILKLPKSLTKDENITLFKKMLNSSKEEAEEIRKNIITGNLRLVVETIKKYRNNVEDQKDLFQIGCIGLIKAVDTFDVTKNMMFSTYATVCISNRVKEYLRKGNMNCGVLGQLKIKIDEYSDEIYKTTGVNPTTEQISEYFNIPHNKVCKALNIRQITTPQNVGITIESIVHLIEEVSFLTVKQVVEQGQCISENNITDTAVTQVQPLLTKTSLKVLKLLISTKLPVDI